MTKDVTTIDDVVNALYQSVCFEKNSEPDFELMRSLFHPRGQVVQPIEDTDGVLKPVSVDDFIVFLSDTLKREGLLDIGAREEEIERRTITFHRVAHVFSAYRFTLIGSEKPLARGVNSFQLVFDSGRWWILSITWDRAKPDEALSLSEYV